MKEINKIESMAVSTYFGFLSRGCNVVLMRSLRPEHISNLDATFQFYLYGVIASIIISYFTCSLHAGGTWVTVSGS